MTQSVDISADTLMQTVHMTGIFALSLNEGGLEALVKEQDPFALANPTGAEGGKGGVGGALFMMFGDNSTIAEVGSGTDIRTGASGIFDLTAEARFLNVTLAQSGASAGKFALGGTFSYNQLDSDTIARLDGNARVTGGEVTVDADDDTRYYNFTGGFAKGESIGIGASVGVNNIERETYAVIGALEDGRRGPWEVAFNNNGDRAELTATEIAAFDGVINTSTVQQGGADTAEVQRIAHEATTGNVQFTFGADQTAALAYDAAAVQVETALNGLASITAAGGVTVTGGDEEPWLITFNTVGARDLITTTVDDDFDSTVYVVETAAGAVNAQEIQEVYHTGSAGALEWTYDGKTTRPLLYNASNSEIQAALNELSTITDAGGVTVLSGNGSEDTPWRIQFNTTGERRPLFVNGLSGFHGDIGLSTTQGGSASAVEKQRLSHNGRRGAFTLSFGGETTRLISYDATSADIQAALNALTSIQSAGNVTVTAADGGASFTNTIDVSGDLTLDATSRGDLYTFSLAASIVTEDESSDMFSPSDNNPPSPEIAGNADQPPSNSLAIAGDISVNLLDDSTGAFINHAGDIAAADVKLEVENDTNLVLASGAVAFTNSGDGTSVGLAGSFAWNQMEGTTEAYVEATNIVDADTLTLIAERNGDLFALTAGAAGAPKQDGIALSGSVSINQISNDTLAYLKDATVDVAGAVDLTATDDSNGLVIAGSFSFGGKAGVGASVAFARLNNNTEATISGSTVEHDGALNLTATNTGQIITVAGSAGISKGALGASGTIAVNLIDNDVEASISNSSNTTNTNPNGAITLVATDDSTIWAFGGAVGGGKKAGLGVAIGFNWITNDVEAFVESSMLSVTGNVSLTADSTAGIRTISAGGAGANKLAAAGGVSVNLIENEIDAKIDGSTVTATGNIGVTATDDATLWALAGNVAGAGKVALGASVGYNEIDNNVRARIQGSTSSITSSGGHVQLLAESTTETRAVTAGGQGAGKVAIGGSISINQYDTDVAAFIGDGVTVDADGNVTVQATDDADFILIAGVINAAGKVAVGVSNTTLVTGNTVEAYIGDATVQADGNQGATSI
ncbi:MAG: hypothetical protein MI725_04190, partial [Pirellulales bacterium]|nr:hypothetical protein [Pirellulales bacterium]